LKYLSVCSGIEAASVAWAPLGWKPVAFSEIEPFPCAVLAHRFPDVPNWGDMTKYEDWPDADVDVLCGGTPCQSFSVAGLRKGLADPRGNLALTYLAIAAKYRPRWLVWENVPGVYSATSHDAPDQRPPDIDLDRDDGPKVGEEVVVVDEYESDEDHAFACFLAGLQELGYGFGYRTLDAQHVRTRSLPRAVPQRRRRVFVVGYLGDWRRAAAVLFDRESLSGHPAPRRETGQGIAARVARSLAIRGRDGTPQIELGDEVANAILTPNGGRAGIGVGAALIEANSGDVGYCLTASAQQSLDAETETLVAVAFDCKGTEVQFTTDGSDPTLRSMGHNHSHQNAGGHAAIAIQERAISENTDAGPQGKGWQEGHAYTLEARPKPQVVGIASAVRRLTPVECERLQGFPDGWTQVPYRNKPAADGPRYKAIGNSWATNCAEWIGERIAIVDQWGDA
jgi:DNA (cytosine-5)-methyltransferase 1